MSKQWGSGFHTGRERGQQVGERHGQAKTLADVGMKALCLATAIRQAQKVDCMSQYVLMDVLIDMLAAQCGGGLDSDEPEACIQPQECQP